MWDRILDYYNEYKKSSNPERSVVSLTNRWSVIKKCTNKFCAAIAQVESLHSSGATEQDKIEKAKIMYREIEKSSYTMEHCWCLLRHQPKWQQHVSMLSTRRKLPGKRLAIADSTPVGDNTVGENVEVIIERPPGKKTEKKRERMRRATEASDSEFHASLTQIHEDRVMFMRERRQEAIKANSDRSELVSEKKRKTDMKIIKLDLAGMNAMQREYFQNLQKEIFEESKRRFSSTSTSPSPSQPFRGCCMWSATMSCCYVRAASS
ncbi:hypothetical protein F2P56_011368 [Juglans regia]|uniref:No apical meristem-associated C-terminal domain-containing protein n=2 Tax=Juglans regia TaxID=51240 RepID=A0A833XTT7_JUGRE|nr:glutathione S-transferase T3-like [Juglans regia]KAF5470881.1 hypothetical protein F2P56_011368 [Juglans regia]